MDNLALPLIPQQVFVGYPPDSGKTAKPVTYFMLDELLTRAWTSDAHTTAYSCEDLPYRLNTGAITLHGGVPMVLFIADIDGPHHLGTDDWWLEELLKLDALRLAFPGAFIYRTQGGYRVLYRLPVSHVLRTVADMDTWKANYLSWVAALRERFKIDADASCQDWTRLYRVPHGTRTPGGRPEHREIIGSPYQIGAWTCEPTETERSIGKALAKKPSKREPRAHQQTVHACISDGNGVFYHAFLARGWLEESGDATKWAVRCPWDEQHTKGTAFNTSTVLFAPGAGDAFGWLHCSHAHCQQHDLRDVLKVFTDDELSRAKKAAGIEVLQAPNKRLVRLYQPYFGLSVKGVRHAS